MTNILKHVDILDLVTITVFRGKPTPGDLNPLVVTLDPIDVSKRLEWDTDALKVLNKKLSDKMKDSDVHNPNTITYIKEFAGKMLSELYKNGLVIISDIPDAPEDPYQAAKKAIQKINSKL